MTPSFSDDDLKRLKELVESDAYKYLYCFMGKEVLVSPDVFKSADDIWKMLIEKIPSILHRLEAAELCAEHCKLLAGYLSKKNPDPFEQGAIEVNERRLDAWLAAKGEGK